MVLVSCIFLYACEGSKRGDGFSGIPDSLGSSSSPTIVRFTCVDSTADPFSEADGDGKPSKKGGDSKDYVHIRVQQRNGKKSLTTVQGLPGAFDLKKILKALKKGKQNDFF